MGDTVYNINLQGTDFEKNYQTPCIISLFPYITQEDWFWDEYWYLVSSNPNYSDISSADWNIYIQSGDPLVELSRTKPPLYYDEVSGDRYFLSDTSYVSRRVECAADLVIGEVTEATEIYIGMDFLGAYDDLVITVTPPAAAVNKPLRGFEGIILKNNNYNQNFINSIHRVKGA